MIGKLIDTLNYSLFYDELFGSVQQTFEFPQRGGNEQFMLTRMQCSAIVNEIDGTTVRPAEATAWLEYSAFNFMMPQLANAGGPLFTPNGNGGTILCSSYQCWEGKLFLRPDVMNLSIVVDFTNGLSAYMHVIFELEIYSKN